MPVLSITTSYTLKGRQPGHHRPFVALEAAELALFLADAPVVLLDQYGNGMEHAMHIDACGPFLRRVRMDSIRAIFYN
jgi:hypothetical protein